MVKSEEYVPAVCALGAVVVGYYFLLSGDTPTSEKCSEEVPGLVPLFFTALFTTIFGAREPAPEPTPVSIIDSTVTMLDETATESVSHASSFVSYIAACLWSCVMFFVPEASLYNLVVLPLFVMIPALGYFSYSRVVGALPSGKTLKVAVPTTVVTDQKSPKPPLAPLPKRDDDDSEDEATTDKVLIEKTTATEVSAVTAQTQKISVETLQEAPRVISRPASRTGSRTSTPSPSPSSLNGQRRAADAASLGDSMTEKNRGIIERLEHLLTAEHVIDDETLRLLNELRELILEVVEDVECGRAEFAALQDANESLKEHVLVLSAKLSDAEDTNAETAALVKTTETRYSASKAEVASLVTQITELQQRNIHLEDCARDADEALLRLRDADTTAAKEMQDENDELTAQLRVATAEIAKKEAEIEVLQGDATEHISVETTRMEASLARATDDLRVARDEVAANVAEHTKQQHDLEEEVAALKAEHKQEVQQLTYALEALTTEQAEVTHLRTELTKVTTACDTQVNLTGMLCEEKAGLVQKVATLEAEAEKLHASSRTAAERAAAAASELETQREKVEHLSESKTFLTRRVEILEKESTIAEESRQLETRAAKQVVLEQNDEIKAEHAQHIKTLESELSRMKAAKEALETDLKTAEVSAQRELTDILENSSHLEHNLEEASLLLQASEEREAGLEKRLEAAELATAQKTTSRMEELEQHVFTLQQKLDTEVTRHAGVERQLRTDAAALEAEMDRVSIVAQDASRRADENDAQEQTVRILSIQLEERQNRVTEAEEKTHLIKQRYDALHTRVVEYIGTPGDGEDLMELLRQAAAEQSKLKNELWGREAELEKRAGDVSKLSGYKGELECALRNTATQLELEKHRSRGVNQELKKLTQRLSILQQNSPRSSSKDRSSRDGSSRSPAQRPSDTPHSDVKRTLDLDSATPPTVPLGNGS